MTRKIVILDSAKEEFKGIKRYVNQAFGEPVWNTVNAEYKEAIQRIKDNPEAGRYIDELQELGMTHYKCILVRQTRVIYEFNQHLVIIHMFINTQRDFRSHLMKRLLRP